jgi:hypothetical protein
MVTSAVKPVPQLFGLYVTRHGPPPVGGGLLGGWLVGGGLVGGRLLVGGALGLDVCPVPGATCTATSE